MIKTSDVYYENFDIHPLAMPFEFQGSGKKSQIGLLFIHSFASSPSEVRPLARFMMNKGYGGIVTLLPGHGTHYQDLKGISWYDWYTAIRNEFLELKKKYKKRFMIGVGLGGILSLLLAASPERHEIDGLILINPTQQRPPPLIINLLPIIKFFRKSFTYDPEIVAELRYQGHFIYSRRPTTSLIELYRAIGFARQRVKQITQPTLLMFPKMTIMKGGKEIIVPYSWYDDLVNCKHKEIYEVEKIIPGRPIIYPRGGKLNEEGKKMFGKIDQFITTVLTMKQDKELKEGQ